MIFVCIAAAIFAADYLLKRHMDETRLQGSRQEILGGRAILRNVHNKKAVFGLLPASSKAVLGGSGFLLGGVSWEFLKLLLSKGSRILKLAYALLLGGGLGNYADRCTKGYVTDYISFPCKSGRISGMVFNLADFSILAGIIFLLPGMLFRKRKI